MVCDWSNTAFQPVEKTPYTRTCVTKQWPAVWIGACFLGPCVIGRLWLLGHWTTKKIIGSQKFDLKIFSVSTVSLRILDIRIYCSFDILGFRRFFQIYLFNANLHKRRSLLRWASERASERLLSLLPSSPQVLSSCSGFDVFAIACRPLRATTKKRKQETSEEF